MVARNNLLFLAHYITGKWQNCKQFRGNTVKYDLCDNAGDANSPTHEKKVTIFTGEYGNDNFRFICRFMHQIEDVFLRKPCNTGPAKFGIFCTCLADAASNKWQRATLAVAEELTDLGNLAVGAALSKTNPNFDRVLEMFKREYYDSDTPRADQLDYVKELQKPREATWKQFVLAVDYMVAGIKHFPKDLDPDGDVLADDAQPRLSTEKYRDFLLASAPTAWFDQLTNTGENPRLI